MATTQEMANTFGAISTTEDVLAGINLTGKRILVTGVSAGLGVKTVENGFVTLDIQHIVFPHSFGCRDLRLPTFGMRSAFP